MPDDNSSLVTKVARPIRRCVRHFFMSEKITCPIKFHKVHLFGEERILFHYSNADNSLYSYNIYFYNRPYNRHGLGLEASF